MIHQDATVDIAERFVANTTGTISLNSYQQMALTSMFFLITGMLNSVNVDIGSFLLTVDTELSIGAGTGSSASFLVSLAAALLQYVKLKTSGAENVSKEDYRPFSWDSQGLKGFSRRELDMICKWGYCAEKIVHGTPSGTIFTCLGIGFLIN